MWSLLTSISTRLSLKLTACPLISEQHHVHSQPDTHTAMFCLQGHAAKVATTGWNLILVHQYISHDRVKIGFVAAGMLRCWGTEQHGQGAEDAGNTKLLLLP
jgi:hypothetical protein